MTDEHGTHWPDPPTLDALNELSADYTAACRADRADRAWLLRSVADAAARLAVTLAADTDSYGAARELAALALDQARAEQRARISEIIAQPRAEQRARIAEAFSRNRHTRRQHDAP